MLTDVDIQKLAEQIVIGYGPKRIILFGSHARGEARPDSDVDLLIEKEGVTDSGKAAIEMALAIRAPFAVDYLIRTPEFVRQRLQWNDPFLTDIIKEGKVLYAG